MSFQEMLPRSIKNRTKLIEYVDDFMLNHPDIDKLVGAKGIDMMKINHQNHAAFISMILLLNRFDSLRKAFHGFIGHITIIAFLMTIFLWPLMLD